VTDPNPYRDLPSVEQLLTDLEGSGLPRRLAVETARTALDRARASISKGEPHDVTRLAGDLARSLRRAGMTAVINASGVLLHTNLGRASLSRKAVEAAVAAAGYPTNVELDLGTGERGGRGGYARKLLTTLTGAEDALVVNNNAGAVLLALAALARGLSVPVARGEMIEIGGSYRLPAVMEAGGAELVEVGTTNRTRLGDFTTALQVHRCGAVLRVHPSNYRVEGFVEDVPLLDLAAETHRAGLPLIHDVGSGLLDGDTPWLPHPRPEWLADEPGVRQSIDSGADVVTFSGDKLLGGPQAGIIVGAGQFVDRLRRHPLARALRIDAVTDAALCATLEAYADDRVDEIPFWRQVTIGEDVLHARAEAVASATGGVVRQGLSLIGAGSVPGRGIETPQVVLPGEDHLFERLLDNDRPILTRRSGKDLWIDLRAVDPGEDLLIAETVANCR
jgi:L-seryl-tRNA(Ser) seleniumtransferase